MKFIDIASLNITVELDILKRDTQRNSIFLYQHKGVFHADNERIGNNIQQEAKTKFLNILTKAKYENTSLVLSPEYSCPKSVIEEIILNADLQPSQNKIWALGGESLDKEDLAYFKNVNDESIHIHFEDCYSTSDKKYVDPLYYILRGQYNGVDKLILLIQFKTHHMGVWSGGDVERNNLIEGNNIYIIKNSNNSIRLISFICSEAMNVRGYLTQQIKDELLWNDMPFLILHPQINPDPSHSHFIDFRKEILDNNKKEIIALNWGKETYIGTLNWYELRSNSPRSGIFFKTSELNYSNDYITKNHKKGLYFLHINREKYVYFLNGFTDLYWIENTPVDMIGGVASQRRKEGAEAIKIFNFTNNFVLEEIANISDNHIESLKERGLTNTYLLNVEKTIIDKEKLLNISTGKIIGKEKQNWSEIIYLKSFELDESSECNNRLTYIEDSYQSSKDVRKNNCEYISKLDEILLDKNNYPSSIEELKHKDIFLSYPSSNSKDYRYNLIDEGGNVKKATVCFVGSETKADANVIYNNIRKIFDPDSSTIRRVVVFYTVGNSIEKIFDPSANLFTETSNDPTSIL